MARRLTRNARKCLKCGDVVESKHQHDCRVCSCGETMVDGGLAYERWGGENSEPLYEYDDA